MNVQQQVPGNLDPEAWGTLRRVLDSSRQAASAAIHSEVFEMIEEDLRVRLAVPIESK